MIETKFKKSEVGLIPEDWGIKQLGNLCDNVCSGANKQRCKTGTYIVYGSTGAIGYSNTYSCQGDTLLIARVGANAGKISKVSGLFDVSDNTLIIKRPKVNVDYLFNYLQGANLNRFVFGSGQPLITGRQVKSLLLSYPKSSTEQYRISEALSHMDDLIATTKNLIEKKRNIKEGAMQDLLSGKRRIKKFETDIKLKQTPVGFIPYNWEIDKIGEQFELLPNNTLPREEMSDNGVVQNIHYGDVLIKFGSIVDVQKDDVPYISSPIFKPNYLIKDGDVIIADTAEDETVGKATEITNVGDNKIVSGLHTMWLHPINKGRYGLGFLGYAFNARIYHNQLLPLMQGTKVTSISKNAIQDTFLVVPPKPEQEAIVSTLSAMDSEIQSLEVRLTKYQSLKQGMMQQLLTGKIRLI